MAAGRTFAVQTLATMALYSLPAVAPAVARDLHVRGTLVGSFVAMAYGVGILSALVSPGMVRRYGGVRATQVVLLAAAGMLALAVLGSGVSGLAFAAVVLGLGYGAAAPASTHLLVPQTPQPVFNLVMSLRQIGVPLGGVLAALILPPLTSAIGWRGALLAELVHLVGTGDSIDLAEVAWVAFATASAESELSTSTAIGVNPAAMRVDPLDWEGRISWRLTRLHRCNYRLSTNANSITWFGRTQRHRNWLSEHGSSCWRRPVSASKRPLGNWEFGARQRVTGGDGGGTRMPPPAWRLV